MASPYDGIPEEKWREITQLLLEKHPLKCADILSISESSWASLWATTIGADEDAISINDLPLPATVIGYFFEKLFAKKLSDLTGQQWRGGHGGEKDLVCVADPSLSIEIKASGQMGLKIFGNRSFGQELMPGSSGKKEKSGYYITVNFYGTKLSLIRFGWIDGSDWQAQKSATGQMAGLGPAVYKGKLFPIKGGYTLNAPVNLLDGVGPKKAVELMGAGISSIRDVLDRGKSFGDSKLYAAASAFRDSYAG